MFLNIQLPDVNDTGQSIGAVLWEDNLTSGITNIGYADLTHAGSALYSGAPVFNPNRPNQDGKHYVTFYKNWTPGGGGQSGIELVGIGEFYWNLLSNEEELEGAFTSQDSSRLSATNTTVQGTLVTNTNQSNTNETTILNNQAALLVRTDNIETVVNQNLSGITSNAAILEIIDKMVSNNVLVENDVAIIYEDDGITVFRRYNLADGDRTLL